MQKQSMEAAPIDFQCLSLSLFSFFVFNQIRLKMFRARPQLHALLEELFSHLSVEKCRAGAVGILLSLSLVSLGTGLGLLWYFGYHTFLQAGCLPDYNLLIAG